MSHRLLFASIHSYLDPSSGAALATRELLELLAARGWDCRALTCGVLDYQNETPLEDVLGRDRSAYATRRRGTEPRGRGGGLRSRARRRAGHAPAHGVQPGRKGTQPARRRPCSSTWPTRCSTDSGLRFC